mgnify:CR=1 FL=1
MPLLPGFESEVAVMRVQLFWEYETVTRKKFPLGALIFDTITLKIHKDSQLS